MNVIELNVPDEKLLVVVVMFDVAKTTELAAVVPGVGAVPLAQLEPRFQRPLVGVALHVVCATAAAGSAPTAATTNAARSNVMPIVLQPLMKIGFMRPTP